MKRIIALACLVVCMGTAFVSTAHASDSRTQSPNPPGRWINTSSIALNMNFSSGTANCSGTIIGNSNVKKIEATFQLLKKNTSGQFVSYYTWPKVTANGNYLTWSGSCSVTPGVYRLQVTAIVTNTSNVSETVTTHYDKEYK